MALKTVLNKVIVEPVEAETKTASGIIIPDSAKEKPQKGVVIATGKGKNDEPMEIKAGDTVLFGKYSGTEIHIDDKKYLVMNQSDILVVLYFKVHTKKTLKN